MLGAAPTMARYARATVHLRSGFRGQVSHGLKPRLFSADNKPTMLVFGLPPRLPLPTTGELAMRPDLARARLRRRLIAQWVASFIAAGLLTLAPMAWAQDAPTQPLAPPAAAEPAPSVRTNLGGTRKEIETTLRNALGNSEVNKKRLNLVVDGKGKSGDKAADLAPETAQTSTPSTPSMPPMVPAVAPIRVRIPAVAPAHRPAAATPLAETAWSYEGEGGPASWGRLKPEYSLCANGKRQSPLAIDDKDTLQGPAEAIQFNYEPSVGLVTNTGRTIQVDVYGNNSLTVRDTRYQLVQFHFHHPAEERINGQGYPMVAHFVHRNAAGQLAVLAVLLNVGDANKLIDRVWTYMPLDASDSVRIPSELINVNEILPHDQRYYQYMGSLTTPPCTEGVLWLVLKQAASISPEQLQLFGQRYANNARPTQPSHGRPIRNALQLQ